VVSPFIPLDTLQSAAADSTICILFTAKREYMCPSSVCTRHQSLWRQAQLVQGGSVIMIILSTCVRQMSEWRGAGMAVCLEQGADLHMAQLMPGHSPSPASVKSRLVLPFWYRLTWLVLDKGPLNGCVCVCGTRLNHEIGTDPPMDWCRRSQSTGIGCGRDSELRSVLTLTDSKQDINTVLTDE